MDIVRSYINQQCYTVDKFSLDKSSRVQTPCICSRPLTAMMRQYKFRDVHIVKDLSNQHHQGKRSEVTIFLVGIYPSLIRKRPNLDIEFKYECEVLEMVLELIISTNPIYIDEKCISYVPPLPTSFEH